MAIRITPSRIAARARTVTVAIAAAAAACSSSSDNSSTGPNNGPTTCTATSVTITGAAAMTVGTPLTLAGTVNGTGCASQTITWSSSDQSALTVSASGVVTAVTAGTATITATSNGQSSTTTLTSTFAAPSSDTRFGYAWASDPANASYVAATSYELNTAGAPITLTHTATGVYAATFAGLGEAAGQKSNVQVVAYGGASQRCNLASSATTGSDLRADVRCFDIATGAPVDTRYDVFVTGQTALQGRSAFVVASSLSTANYYAPAATTYTSTRAGVRISRSGTGAYTVTLGGLARGATDGPETIQITAIGTTAQYCTNGSWGTSGADLSVSVACFASGGTPADAPFSLLMVERGRTGQRTGFAWTNDATTTVAYAPSAGYALNSSGGAISSLRTGTGAYTVTFTGLSRTTALGETMLVTAYGGVNVSCNVAGWSYPGAFVNVRCYDATGAAVDSRFTILWVE